jgi:parallel beta-helix repeat protein
MAAHSETAQGIKRLAIVAVAILVITSGFALLVTANASSPSPQVTSPTIIQSGSMTETASYVIFEQDGNVFAKNGTTGAIDFRDTDVSDIIQICVDMLPSSGGTIYITGTYELSTRDTGSITNYSIYLEMDNVTITGDAIFSCFAPFDSSWAYMRVMGDHNTIAGLTFNFKFDGTALAKRGIMITGNDDTVKDCKFIGYGRGTGIDTRQYSDIHHGYRFVGNYFSNMSGIALHSATGSVIAENTIMDCPLVGIQVYSNCEGNLVTRNYLENRIQANIDASNRGIFIGHGTTAPGSCNNNTVSSNTIANHYSDIYIHTLTHGNIIDSNRIINTMPGSTVGVFARDNSVHIINNWISCSVNSSFTSIQLADSFGGTISGNTIDARSNRAQISVVLRPDMVATITGNIVTAYRGIFLSYGNGVTISGNTLVASDGGDYGIYLGYDNGLSANVTVKDNIIKGFSYRSIYSLAAYTDNVTLANNMVDKTIQNSGHNAVTQYNIGHKTEASGSATILSGQTYVTVTHGLASTPTKIVVTGAHSETASLYVSSVSGTTLSVNVLSSVTADRIIYWYAEV